MELIKQEDVLHLNITEIDSQHESLIGLINLLHETMLQGSDKAAMELLSQLLERTRSHFVHEEQLMSKYNYPGYKAHKSEHDRLMQHLVDFSERYKNAEFPLSFAVVAELKDWAVVHIEKSDKPLGDFIKNPKGVDTTPG